MSHFNDAVRTALKEQVDELSRFIAAGKCESFEMYKAKVGEKKGLERAIDTFNSVAKRHGEMESDE